MAALRPYGPLVAGSDPVQSGVSTRSVGPRTSLPALRFGSGTPLRHRSRTQTRSVRISRLVAWLLAVVWIALVGASLVLDQVASRAGVAGIGSWWLYPFVEGSVAAPARVGAMLPACGARGAHRLDPHARRPRSRCRCSAQPYAEVALVAHPRSLPRVPGGPDRGFCLAVLLRLAARARISLPGREAARRRWRPFARVAAIMIPLMVVLGAVMEECLSGSPAPWRARFRSRSRPRVASAPPLALRLSPCMLVGALSARPPSLLDRRRAPACPLAALVGAARAGRHCGPWSGAPSWVPARTSGWPTCGRPGRRRRRGRRRGEPPRPRRDRPPDHRTLVGRRAHRAPRPGLRRGLDRVGVIAGEGSAWAAAVATLPVAALSGECARGAVARRLVIQPGALRWARAGARLRGRRPRGHAAADDAGARWRLRSRDARAEIALPAPRERDGRRPFGHAGASPRGRPRGHRGDQTRHVPRAPVHDPALGERRDLLESVLAAAGLTIEIVRLRVDVKTSSRRSRPRASASSRPAISSGDGSSATAMTEPSSAWSRSGCICGAWSAASAPGPGRRSGARRGAATRSAMRSQICASSRRGFAPRASTRPGRGPDRPCPWRADGRRRACRA